MLAGRIHVCAQTYGKHKILDVFCMSICISAFGFYTDALWKPNTTKIRRMVGKCTFHLTRVRTHAALKFCHVFKKYIIEINILH